MAEQKKDPTPTENGSQQGPTNKPSQVTNQPDRITNEGPLEDDRLGLQKEVEEERQPVSSIGATPGTQETVEGAIPISRNKEPDGTDPRGIDLGKNDGYPDIARGRSSASPVNSVDASKRDVGSDGPERAQGDN